MLFGGDDYQVSFKLLSPMRFGNGLFYEPCYYSRISLYRSFWCILIRNCCQREYARLVEDILAMGQSFDYYVIWNRR